MAPTMTHRERLEAFAAIMLGMFVAFLSSTIVSNALPTIIRDLHGSQDQYTWIVVATLLAATATTPIWGKLADRTSKKLLVQLSLVIFTLGSVLAGLSQTVPQLIGARAVQGLGLGGIQALAIIVIAAMFSPRERGRYQGPMAVVMSVATISGPLIGGIVVDTPWLGWRWTFFLGVPLALIAVVVVQRTLNLPVIRKPDTHVDYLGAALIAAGVSALLIWVTLAGKQFEWGSTTSYALAAAGIIVLALALVVEMRSPDPIIPLRVFRERTITLATLASIAVGIALFGASVFLGQYFQIARGYSPTTAGLLTMPMMVGSMISAIISGQLITRTGKWKRYLVAGSATMTVGFLLLSTLDHTTDIRLASVYLFILGIGMGMTMQNLVLAVQNTVNPKDLGAASATVTFFRSLGGAAGVSVLGAVLSTHIVNLTDSGLRALGIDLPAGVNAGIGSLDELPAPIAEVVRGAYGDGTARIFLISAVLALGSLIAIGFIRESVLRTQTGDEQLREELREQREAEMVPV
ncbi:MFS transporter [Hoyosella altamirensis]|uniref:MFS transporter n=1 Tax=Hoyosella altamirensis TaxID=616997 RepID=UPI0007DB3A89|nr:MDR family MFS transporter [Hoyosella altamirensis]